MEYMAAQMDRQIEGAISENERLSIENERLSIENDQLRELVSWAYSKLHNHAFISMDDVLKLDEMKLLLEHGI